MKFVAVTTGYGKGGSAAGFAGKGSKTARVLRLTNMTKMPPAISLCGRRPSQASFTGRQSWGPGAPGGTLSARRWR